jgi:hypothetical protein
MYQHYDNKRFNTFLIYFIYLQSTFYTSIDVHTLKMTYRKESKQVGILVF